MKTQPAPTSLEVVSDKNVLDVVTEIASQPDQEEPFYVVDLADIVYKHKLWKIKLPRVAPYYAVKCNDCPLILELLASLGTGFDCASKSEIESILSLGVEPSRLIYANPCKTRSFIKHAASVGVDLMTFDNETELHKISILHPGAQMVLRLRVDDNSAQCALGIKFGCLLSDAPGLLETAKSLGIAVVGISFHVGSGCRDFTAYNRAIANAKHLFDYGSKLGFHMNLLDIGGGFPGNLGSYALFEEASNIINESLDIYFPSGCGVNVIAEPGRYYVASAFTLCTNIIAKRQGHQCVPNISAKTEEQLVMYYVNDGVYGSFNCLIFDHAAVHPIPIMIPEDRPLMECSLWGPTCDSIDRITERSFLPQMEVGEWIAFENMGAYTVAAASTFNGFQKPALRFILPMHTLVYLQQLPSWPQLCQYFDESDVQLLNADELDDELVIPRNLFKVLPVSKPLSA